MKLKTNLLKRIRCSGSIIFIFSVLMVVSNTTLNSMVHDSILNSLWKTFQEDQSDIVLFSIGSRGFKGQEVPPFIVNMATKYPQLSFHIISASVGGESILECDTELKTQFKREISQGSMWGKFERYKHTKLPLIVSSFDIGLPIDETEIQLKDFIKRKLSENKIIFMGNYVGGFNMPRTDQIAGIGRMLGDLYKELKTRSSENLILIQNAVSSQASNQLPLGSFYLYNPPNEDSLQKEGLLYKVDSSDKYFLHDTPYSIFAKEPIDFILETDPLKIKAITGAVSKEYKHILPTSPLPKTIYINILNRGIIEVDVEPNNTYDDIREKIKAKLGLSTDDQIILIHAGSRLKEGQIQEIILRDASDPGDAIHGIIKEIN